MTGLWQDCLTYLRDEIPEPQFNTWIRPLVASSDGDELILSAPNRFIKDWVRDKYLTRIQQILLEENDGRMVRVNLVAGESKPMFATQVSKPEPVRPQRVETPVEKKIDFAAPREEAIDESLGVLDSELSVEEMATMPGTSLEAPLPKRKNKPDVQVEGGVNHKSFLNMDFTFDRFVEGKSNQLAHAAAQQVAENPGGAYNPLFIYGGVGLGKTHLMHAVGHALQDKNPNAKVLYVHSERFVQDMVKALQLNAISDFKRFYRSLDVLLIDDIQFFAKKDRSQEEFFHTFNSLLEGRHQMILTCDRYPKEIEGLEERLKSRFGWGLTVGVEPPELETRVAILMKKAQQMNLNLTDDVAFFIAQKLRSNVRELEGALKRISASAKFRGTTNIDLNFIKETLKDLLALQSRQVSIENIQRVVADYYKMKVSDLSSKRRTRSVARPRQIAMALSKELTNHSLPEIGERFGGRDHTTVLHACRKVKELQETNEDVREDFKNLLRTLST